MYRSFGSKSFPRGTKRSGDPRAPKNPMAILIDSTSDNQEISATSLFFFFCLRLQNKEIEELTKICDELIAKMGKS